MATNFVAPGEVLPLVAPSGGVVSGTAYLIGAIFCISTVDAEEDETFAAALVGVFDLVKATGTSWGAGDLLYWDDGAGEVVTEPEGNTLIGVAVRDEESAAAVGRVRLNGAATSEGSGAVSTAEIANGAVTIAKAAVFISAETTGTGSSQNIAHGLGVAPTKVFVAPTDTAPAVAGVYTVAEGSHDGTNVVLTVTSGKKFKVLAWA